MTRPLLFVTVLLNPILCVTGVEMDFFSSPNCDPLTSQGSTTIQDGSCVKANDELSAIYHSDNCGCYPYKVALGIIGSFLGLVFALGFRYLLWGAFSPCYSVASVAPSHAVVPVAPIAHVIEVVEHRSGNKNKKHKKKKQNHPPPYDTE